MQRLRDVASFVGLCFSKVIVVVCLVWHFWRCDHGRRMSDKEFREDCLGIVFAKATIEDQLVKHHCDFLQDNFVKFFYALPVNLGSIGRWLTVLHGCFSDLCHGNNFLSNNWQDISIISPWAIRGVIDQQLAWSEFRDHQIFTMDVSRTLITLDIFASILHFQVISKSMVK